MTQSILFFLLIEQKLGQTAGKLVVQVLMISKKRGKNEKKCRVDRLFGASNFAKTTTIFSLREIEN